MKQFFKNYDRFFFAPASASALGWARICVSLFTFLFLTNLDHPHYPDSPFYQHWTPNGFFTLLSGPVDRSWFENGLLLFKFFLVLSFLGLGTRVTTFFSFLIGFLLHGYFTSFSNEVYHHSQMAILALGILSLGPVNASLSLDRLITKKSFFNNEDQSSHRFPLTLLSLWVASVYTTAGIQKLVYGEGIFWALSQNLRLRLYSTPRLTDLGESLLHAPDIVIYFFALLGLAVEVLAPLALWRGRFFLVFAILWIGLHFFVSQIMGGHRAFFSQVGCYIALIPFMLRDYDRR